MNPSSLEKWLILGLGEEMYKMSLEYPVVPEKKKCSKQNKPENPQDGSMAKRQGNGLKELHWQKLEV